MSIAATEVSLLREQVGMAFALGADYVEIRIDFLKPDKLQSAIDVVKDARSKAVFTLRSKGQGGSFAGSEQERVDWLKKLAEQKPMLLDVELYAIKNNDELAD